MKLMQGTEPWQLMSNGKAATVRVHGRFKADNGVALAAAAVAGLGIAALPDFLTEADITSGALVSVLADHPPPEASLFCPASARDFPQRKVRALIEMLVERFG